MGSITLTQPTSGTLITAGLHATNYGTLQTVINGNLENVNIKATAAIDYSKLNLTNSIVNTDIASGAAIARTKLADPPQARVTKSSTQSMTSGSWALVTWDTESFDTDTIHDNATNNDRLTCKTAGVYLVCVNLEWAGNVTGIRAYHIQKNDSALPGTAIGGNDMSAPSTSITLEQPATLLVSLAVNDYLTLAAFQNSGGGLNIQTPSSFAMTRISA